MPRKRTNDTLKECSEIQKHANVIMIYMNNSQSMKLLKGYTYFLLTTTSINGQDRNKRKGIDIIMWIRLDMNLQLFPYKDSC